MSSRRRKDSNSFVLSQRSNGLHFSHHFQNLSPGLAPRRQYNSILSQIDGNSPARPREKPSTVLIPVSEHPKDDDQYILLSRQPIRSLIPPTASTRYKAEPNVIRRRRNSSSSASVKSITSSLLSYKRRSALVPTPSLATMPAEILDIIFASLAQLDLHALMLANSNFVEVAATYLYSHPLFFSTYRFAQFVWVVSHRPHYASMVRILDLSYLSKIAIDPVSGELLPLAGWREFKYRNHDLYRARARSSPLASGSPRTSNHSLPSPFLKSYHRTRDVPIGGLCHVLAACPRIRKLNLSRVQLAADFLVSSPRFKPTATQGLLFVSDVPKSWTWASSDLQPVYAEEVVRWVCQLTELESLKARACLWLTTVRVEKLMSTAQNSLAWVDFRESGMQKEVRWATKGNKIEVERIVREVIENTREVVVT